MPNTKKQKAFNLVKRSGICLATLIASHLAHTPLAIAQTDAASSKRETYNEALRAIDARQWHKARELLLKLWSEIQTYDVAYSLAKLEFHLENHAAVAQFTARALELLPPTEKDEVRQKLAAALDEAKARVGTLRVELSDPKATVRIDNQPVERHALNSEVYVSPGKHDIEATLGPATVTKSVTVAAGETRTISLNLEQQTKPVVAPDDHEPSPATPTPVDAGTDTDTEADGQGRSMLPAYIGSGVAALGLAGGIVFTWSASDAKEESEQFLEELGRQGCVGADASNPNCVSAQGAFNRWNNHADLANVSWTVFGLASLATLGYVFLWPEDAATTDKSGRPSTLTWSPGVAIDATSKAAFITGRF